jgi:hypothetical protein
MQAPSTAPAYAHINVIQQVTATTSGWGRYLCCFLSLFIFILIVHSGNAQCTRQVRVYANTQQFYGSGLLGLLPGTIQNGVYAVDGLPDTRSTLQVDLGLLNASHAIQYLQFPQSIAANTPVTVKLTLPASAVGLVDNFQIQPFTNLHWNNALAIFGGQRWEADAAGAAYAGATLLNALSGKGDVEITITPTVGYNGIWIDLGSLVGLAVSMDVYHAYITKDATGNIDCEERIDVLAGVRAGTAVGGIANATGGISNPGDPLGTLGTAKWAVVDNDPAYTTYAQLNTGVQVLSEVYHSTLFSTPSIAGDSVRIVLQDPGGILLNLGVLNGLTIQPYLGSTAAGPALDNTSSFLSLNLLPGAGNKYVLTAPISASFDKVEIKIGGVAGALQSLRIYDVSRIMHVPVTALTINGNAMPAAVCLNQASGLTFSVTNSETCATYAWYDASGTLVTTGVAANGLSFTPPVTSAGTYAYTVKASRNGCSNAAAQAPISYTLYPTPVTPVAPPVTICTGQSATLTVTNPETGIAYYWYSTATGDVPPANAISSGTSYTTGTPPAFTTYYVAAYNPVTHCISDNRGQGNITITPHPGVPSLSIQPNN